MRPSVLVASLLPSLVVAAASAQWTSDAATNTSIGDGVGEQVLPKIASRADGGAYVGWFDSGSGAYTVRLQRLDPEGNEMWGHNGILVSANAQQTSLVDWDLIADSSGNVVLTFCDIRAGGDLDVYGYRVGSDGTQLWGANGVAISVNADFEAAPVVAELSTGDFAFVWGVFPNTGSGAIRMQRVSPAGVTQLAENGVKIGGLANEKPGFTQIVPSADGSAIVSWVRNTASFSSPRHVHAQRVDQNGGHLWNGGVGNVVISNQSVPIAYTPKLLADGKGGALFVWHRSLSNVYSSFVQHLDVAGTAAFPANGFEVSTEGTFYRLDPSAEINPATGDITVIFRKHNTAQSQRGLYAQRISARGVRLWGAGGKELRPVDGVDELFPRIQLVDGDALVTWFESPTVLNSTVVGARLDSNGDFAWSPSVIDVSSTVSAKDDPEIARGTGDSLLVVWSDERNGPADSIGQRMNADGTLGNQPEGLLGDINGDNVVDGADLGLLLGGWGQPGASDLNNDGTTDGADLAVLLGAWS
ncbi:MAG: hypothetical protein JNM94_08270 [Phycisphaerae bacterium]|nr:hypothetical protein [Phycisphaerae bacterium]